MVAQPINAVLQVNAQILQDILIVISVQGTNGFLKSLFVKNVLKMDWSISQLIMRTVLKLFLILMTLIANVIAFWMLKFVKKMLALMKTTVKKVFV